MRPHETRRTFRVLGVLILGLVIGLPAVQAQTSATAPNVPCLDANGNPRPGTLEATLVSGERGDDLVLYPSGDQGNVWEVVEPQGATFRTSAQVVDRAKNRIVVPDGFRALLTVELPSPPKQMRFVTELTEDGFQPVGPDLLIEQNGAQLVFCNDNSENLETRMWSFGVMLDDEWYDPQLENEGEEPPPP